MNHNNCCIAVLVLISIWQSQAGSAQISAESNQEAFAYQYAVRQSEPSARAISLELFLQTYPHSAHKQAAVRQLLLAYELTGTSDKASLYAEQVLMSDPQNPLALKVVVSKKRALADAGQDPDRNLLDARNLSERGLMSLNQSASAGLPEIPRFRASAIAVFHGAMGAYALKENNFLVASEHFRSAVEVEPDHLQNVYGLAVAYVSQQPPDLSNGFRFLARAVNLSAGSPSERQISDYAKRLYVTYNKTESGWNELLASEKSHEAPQSKRRIEGRRSAEAPTSTTTTGQDSIPVASPPPGAAQHETLVSKTPGQILAQNQAAVVLLASADATEISLGSGFFVGNGSLLVTNFHVIEGARKVALKNSDGTIVEIDRVAGFNADEDIAVLKVNPASSSALTLGDSDKASTGDTVVVISNPEGLERSISNGLVSGIRDLGNSIKLFQISAPVSHGSSGAPVFDQHGRVIGVIRSSLEAGQNLNFAIPINSVKPLLLQDRNLTLSELPPRRPAGAESQAETLTGSWVAVFADSITTGQLLFNMVVRESGEVVGTYTSTAGAGGRISGKAVDNQFQFQLTQSMQDCPGTYSGSAPISAGAIVGTYTGDDCQGHHGEGTFTMTRNTSGAKASAAPPAAPAVPAKPVIAYGSESELTGVRTVYVYCEDFDARWNIVQELRKHNDVTVTDEIGRADAVLVFAADIYSLGQFAHVWRDYYGNVYGTTTPRYAISGVGFAIKFDSPNTLRVVWRFEDTRTTVWERRPSTNFARNFIKTMQKVHK